MPTCKSFWITEVGYSYRLDRGEGNFYTPYLTWEVGLMANQGERSALGASFIAGYSDDYFRLGLKPRLRHRLNRSISLELSPGILLAGNNGKFPGFTGHVSVNFQDRLALTIRLEASDRTSWAGDDVTNVAWYAGINFGSEMSIAAIALEILLGAVTLAVFGDLPPDY